MKWPNVQFHLVDKQTRQFLSYDRYADDPHLFVSMWGNPFILSFDDAQMSEARIVAKEWGKPVIVSITVDGRLY